jgi:DNA-binding beta-propeller fold protein YncE
VPVGQHPGGLAVDPGNHTVYVPNYSDNTVSVIESK